MQQQLPSSLLVLSSVPGEAALSEIDALLPQIPFEDGRNTASGAAREVKHNQ